jgi:CRP-like cAMP-binding protein
MHGISHKSDEKSDSRLYQALGLHSYRYGDEVVQEGSESPCFFVILSGQVKISKRGKFIRLLRDQDVFGLESILFKQYLPYSAKVMTTSRIASYAPEALDHFVRENPRMTASILTSTVDQLLQTTENLVQDEGTFALENARVDYYSDGDIIVQEGAPETDFFRLVSSEGGLKVTKAGKEISRIEKPGEFFGEMAGLLNLPRVAAVTSIGKSVIERYGFNDLDVIVRDYPEVALHIMRTLVIRLMKLTSKYTDVSEHENNI